jgi:hypothetical protein
MPPICSIPILISQARATMEMAPCGASVPCDEWLIADVGKCCGDVDGRGYTLRLEVWMDYMDTYLHVWRWIHHT